MPSTIENEFRRLQEQSRAVLDRCKDLGLAGIFIVQDTNTGRSISIQVNVDKATPEFALVLRILANDVPVRVPEQHR